MQVLATWAPEDGLLGAVAPLGLAAARPTCLVIDLDPGGPNYPGDQTLANLVAEGPTREDLEPTREGVALLPNGGVTADDAAAVVRALCIKWPAVVVRLAPSRPSGDWPMVPVRPLLPGNLFGPWDGSAVYQKGSWSVPIPAGSLALPPPRPATLAALLAGMKPRRSAWVKAWRSVWEKSWG